MSGTADPSADSALVALIGEVARGAAEGASEASVLELLLERGHRMLSCDALLLVLSDEDAERFRIQALETALAEVAATAGRTYRRAGSLEERALREGTQVAHASGHVEPGTVLDALTRAVQVDLVIASGFATRALGSGAIVAVNPRLETSAASRLVESLAALSALAISATARLLGESPARGGVMDEAAVAKLARSHRLAALGELAAGVAHDLNNALNPIVSFAQLIRDDPGTPPHVRTYAERVLMAATDGAETVQRVQGVTARRRGEGRRRETVDLGTAAHEALELSRPTWGERQTGGPVTLSVSIDAGLYAEATASEVREALLNLINNALDAMPAGGALRVVGCREGRWALLAVQDSGVGMAQEVKVRALEPFFTTKGARGTGLGLSEVAAIARRHGGSVEIDSWPRLGTSVQLRLPAVDGPRVPGVTVAPARRPAGTPRVSVLLVDDNVLNAEAIAASLRAAGHEVAIADTAEAGLGAFASGHYDVVITDLGLPGMGGYEFIREVRARAAGVRVGVVTGWAVADDAAQLVEHGISFWFTKPVNPQDLLSALVPPDAP